MTPKQQQFHDILNDASLQTALRGFHHETARPFTHKETAETLMRIADAAPHLLQSEIESLQAKIDLLRAYLPEADDAT
ncbi:hypothetical protein C7441_11070 [Pseudaminobacter salicylatoxidans]|uniref:Uncharacterized protein n=1 Tax=Pseudaminobacter salicylatoxidans TaxID=93369 RepID=A0A316C5B6_PSESE|nr:hypothetical protein [Pseudaminobacter salicylatoxidans]PWJ81538.1 hypothetical protein C7441_11070 [Pseudaminobacter salicylatoxidans]